MSGNERLGRSLEHLLELSADLQARGVDLVVLDQGIDTSTAVGRMFFQILGAIARVRARADVRTHDGRPRRRPRTCAPPSTATSTKQPPQPSSRQAGCGRSIARH